jgi:MFS superfamily sulfate permease-like transporter
MIQERVGGKTQIAGLVSCGVILTVLLLLAPFLYHLPKVGLIERKKQTLILFTTY